MMESEFLANFCEKQLQERLSHFNNSEVIQFTESIRHGVRYIGFKFANGHFDQEFLIEINVKEV